MRYADVSDSKIAFVYGGDIWIVDKAGGTASQLTHSPGEESYPRFSPDGSEIRHSSPPVTTRSSSAWSRKC